jgi:hypothetical protein
VLTPFDYCHTESPWLFQIKGNGAYQVPKIDVVLSATFVSVQGPAVLAQLNVAQRADGSPLNFGNQLVNVFAEYLQRCESAVQFAVRRAAEPAGSSDRQGPQGRQGADVDQSGRFNLFNANAATRENPNFAVFRQPTEIMLARFAKIGAQIDF